jgi:hypothetical protein
LYALSKEEERLKARIKKLSGSGFYENYKQISMLKSEIKKIQSRMETIRIKESSGTCKGRFKTWLYSNRRLKN